ncbi:MAG: orotidine-5'-phosphate decarboxylase [Actinomycetota bacterium]
MSTTSTDTDVRSRIAIALDVPTLDEATRLADAVAGSIGVAKIGLQLFSAAGPAAVEVMRQRGFDVLLDLKLHDIPNTVAGAAREIGRMGVRYVTSHTQGGEAMLRAAVDGLAEGADEAGLAAPRVLAVTVLTSDTEASPQVLTERVGIAAAAGCGVVCAAPDLATVKAAAPSIFALVPGIRLADGERHDQSRVATPTSAIAAGADLLVLGRAVSGASDPAAAAAIVADEVRRASMT